MLTTKRLIPEIEQWKDENKVQMCKRVSFLLKRFPDVRFIMLTLTAPNGVSIKQMASAQWKILKERFQENSSVYGYASCPDFKWENNAKSHYHYHVIVAVRPNYFTGRDFMSHRLLTAYFKYCLNHYADYGVKVDNAIVDVRSVKEDRDSKFESVMKAVQYAGKLQPFETTDYDVFRYNKWFERKPMFKLFGYFNAKYPPCYVDIADVINKDSLLAIDRI